MIILPTGKPMKPNTLQRHHRRVAEAMRPTQQRPTVWMLEIMALMVMVDVGKQKRGLRELKSLVRGAESGVS